MAEEPLTVMVIIGSTRAGRFGPTVADWLCGELAGRTDMDVDMLDAAEAGHPERLGGFDEPPPEPVLAASARIAAADAFVVVTPEYNHSYPAPLKTLIDWHAGWQAKPVAFVSYGGMSGGLRAVEHLRAVFAETHSVTIRDTVSFHGAWARFDQDGRPLDVEGCGAAAKTMLDQLAWWATALRTARAAHPYAA
jgi:NAD(P)H-dependent FMN reductase